MPTVLRAGPSRVYFTSHDMGEPPHVHVDRGDQSAEFWLSPVALARNLGSSASELRAVEQILKEHEQDLVEAYNEFFGR